MNTPSLLLITLPISNIFLSNISPIHRPHSAFHILFPFPFKIISWRIIVHLSVSFFHIILEITFKNTTALEDDLPFTLLFALNPLPFICGIINCIFSIAVSESIFYLSLISASIRPFIYALSCNSIICKFSIVNNTISPYKFTFAVQKSIIKFAFILVAIFKDYFSWPI